MLKIESLPWHTFVEHLPVLHHHLGSLAELLSLEHEGEHGHQPLALYTDTWCSHQGDVLNQMRGTSYMLAYQLLTYSQLITLACVVVAASYLKRYNEDFSSHRPSTGHMEGFGRVFNHEDIPNLYLPSCLLQVVPLLLPNLIHLHSIFAAQGWGEFIKPDGLGEGWVILLNHTSSTMNYLCVGHHYGCFSGHGVTQ